MFWSPSIPRYLITGTNSQSAAIHVRKTPDGEDHLSLPSTPTLLPCDAPQTPLPPARKQRIGREQQQEHPKSEPVSGPNKQSMDSVESADIVKPGAGTSGVAGQGSGFGVSSYYKPTRRGSPRPSIHNQFDINEHLPWMIVLLLLLVLVVIVVCSVKRSSRVLKKGPMQDPSSIVEKAIQKKPSAPSSQIKEKWIYYCNGQGKLVSI